MLGLGLSSKKYLGTRRRETDLRYLAENCHKIRIESKVDLFSLSQYYFIIPTHIADSSIMLIEQPLNLFTDEDFVPFRNA